MRLGDQATREDGLVGYFEAGQPGIFSSVATPPAEPGSPAAAAVIRIGAARPDGTGNYLWRRFGGDPGQDGEILLVLDPRGAVTPRQGFCP